MFRKPNTVLITGANSGLGRALALKYAKAGAELYITGRNEIRLEKVKKACEKHGATVHKKCIDLKKTHILHAWLEEIKDEIDMVIANAGISAGTGGGGESLEQVQNIFDTNINGVIHTIHPIMEAMKKRRKGQVVIISSMAGYRGLPSSPAYSASKAAVKVYGEGLRGYLSKFNVGVTVVTPGYIKTPMTDVNDFYMPFLMSAKKAAAKIYWRLKLNPSRIAFPLPLYLVVWLISALPPFIIDPIMALLPSKPNEKQQQEKDEK